MASGRSGVQKHLGRTCPLCPFLDDGGQHRAGQFATVSVDTGGAVQDLRNFLNSEKFSRTEQNQT